MKSHVIQHRAYTEDGRTQIHDGPKADCVDCTPADKIFDVTAPRPSASMPTLFEPEPLPLNQLRVRRWIAEDIFTLEIANPGGTVPTTILTHVLPRVVELFLIKARDYTREDGTNWSEILGEKAQFVDMWRKMGKLYNGLWEGRELDGESVEEILMDLVGHILLTLEKRTRSNRGVVALKTDV